MPNCGSYPHCKDDAAPGKRFCEFHQEILDRVKSAPKAPKVIKRAPAPVTVSQIPGKREQLENEIVEALTEAGQPVPVLELRQKLNVERGRRTFNRACDKLLSDGRISKTGATRASRYSLAQG